jgi:hypothetical protein
VVNGNGGLQMKKRALSAENGNTILIILGTVVVLSVIAGNILLNCVTRYNVVSSQVRSWKNALYAAEAGGDIAYAETRKTILDPLNAFTNWDVAGSVHTSSELTIGNDGATTSSTVDRFFYDASGNPWYRIRVRGTAPFSGVNRAGMDDRLGSGVRGDSLLRKIDFNYDHFVAAYGPNGDGVGKTLTSVSRPQVTRRLELIAGPVTAFEAALKCLVSFSGPGSAGVIDSYDSRNGPYSFVANNPAAPYYADSHSGSVAVGTPDYNQNNGPIYGNVSTNGGSVVPSSKIIGTIDNNVPFTLPPFTLPTNLGFPQASPTQVTSATTITPPSAGTATAPIYYVLSSFTNSLTINAFNGANTYVAVHATSGITGKITVKPTVYAKIFFDGNMAVKGRDIDNQSGIASHLQFYAISPSDPATPQTIDIQSPSDYVATFYAPSADFHTNGNPDITGAIVCKTYYGNGNTALHYDRELAMEGIPIDYRVASYVEDIR